MKITYKIPPMEVGNPQKDLNYSKTGKQSLIFKGRKMRDIHIVKNWSSELQHRLKSQVCP